MSMEQSSRRALIGSISGATLAALAIPVSCCNANSLSTPTQQADNSREIEFPLPPKLNPTSKLFDWKEFQKKYVHAGPLPTHPESGKTYDVPADGFVTINLTCAIVKNENGLHTSVYSWDVDRAELFAFGGATVQWNEDKGIYNIENCVTLPVIKNGTFIYLGGIASGHFGAKKA